MRLIVVSNRLPVVLERVGESWEARPGSGGLVTALSRLLVRNRDVWIGWPGIADIGTGELEAPLQALSESLGYEVTPVALDTRDCQGFYQGFSNEIVWPLFHDLQSRCNFVPTYWDSYCAVIDKFAEVVQRTVRPGDFVWVQDYHLMGLGARLRERGLSQRLAFFLHIPFPPPDIFAKLPWRRQVLDSLLRYDAVGFQTVRDQRNFLNCVREFVPSGRVQRGGQCRVQYDGHSTAVSSCPIGIDYEEFADAATQPGVARRVRELRAEMPDRQIILGVDRLDYTKGIPCRLKAFQLALRRHAELHRKVTLLQVVVPSRQGVPEYQDLKCEIERLVAQINGEFTQPGWVPIHYVYREIERCELVAYYRMADLALVTPLKDGMNLVSKEYCACQVDCDGVLILSEFAGAADQLHGAAVLVNPYDLDQVADTICRAVHTTAAERRPAMKRLKRTVQRKDVHWWARRFLAMLDSVPAPDCELEPELIGVEICEPRLLEFVREGTSECTN